MSVTSSGGAGKNKRALEDAPSPKIGALTGTSVKVPAWYWKEEPHRMGYAPHKHTEKCANRDADYL